MQINIEDKRACLVSISSFENVAQEGSLFLFITASVLVKIDRTFPYLTYLHIIYAWVNLDNYTLIRSKVLTLQNGFPAFQSIPILYFTGFYVTP